MKPSFPRIINAALLAGLVVGLALILLAPAAQAGRITRVTSKSGIEAWLVSDSTLPLIAINFAFRGGAAQDPADKPGTAYLAALTLDEGAGDLDSLAFRDALDRKAIEMQFRAGRDELRGAVRMLSAHRIEAARLLKLALNAPRFDAEPVERVRNQMLASLRRQSTDPDQLASDAFWREAYGDHPYGRPTDGTLKSVPTITPADLKAFVGKTLARDNLKIAVVGDIDAATLGEVLDEVFGALPAKAQLQPVPRKAPQNLGKQFDLKLDVPQAVMMFGGNGLPRNDPDFMSAYIVNHIVGGGTFSSRLYGEVREKRGLAYSVYTSLIWLDHSALFAGTTATRAERAGETLDLIGREIKRIATEGPNARELAEAKSYLKGAQMLALDTSTKFAAQLVQYQLDNLGIDYLQKRAGLIDAVSLDDARRAAKRVFGDGMLVTLVGPDGGAPADKAKTGTARKAAAKNQKPSAKAAP